MRCIIGVTLINYPSVINELFINICILCYLSMKFIPSTYISDSLIIIKFNLSDSILILVSLLDSLRCYFWKIKNFISKFCIQVINLKFKFLKSVKFFKLKIAKKPSNLEIAYRFSKLKTFTSHIHTRAVWYSQKNYHETAIGMLRKMHINIQAYSIIIMTFSEH